jgi:hypothetical protein
LACRRCEAYIEATLHLENQPVALSLYDASIPGYLRLLKNLAVILEKGEAHAIETGKDPQSYLQTKLAPDMGDLVKQVQFASDAAKGGAARLAGMTPPSFEDNETNFAELKARVAKTIAFVESVKREDVDGQEGRTIELKFPGRTMSFNALDFLFGFSLPNFHFHVTTAYDVLRHAGVPLSKMDYLAGAPMQVTMHEPA